MIKKKTFIILLPVISLIIITVAAVTAFSDNIFFWDNENKRIADKSGKSEVVAYVNNVPIYKNHIEFSKKSKLSSKLNSEIFESLLNVELSCQEADRLKITVTKQEINDYINNSSMSVENFKKQDEKFKEEYLNYIKTLNIDSYEQFIDDVWSFQVEKLLKSNKLNEYILKDEPDEIKSDIKKSINIINSYLKDLKKKADIKIVDSDYLKE